MKPFVVGVLTIIATVGMSQQSPVTPPPPIPTKPVGKLRPVSPPEDAQAKAVLVLLQHVQDLEKLVNELNTREKERAAADASRRLSLLKVKFELSHFDCTPEWDKSAALALAEHDPFYAYQGSGAMMCTQRLANIVSNVVESLDRQQ